MLLSTFSGAAVFFFLPFVVQVSAVSVLEEAGAELCCNSRLC